MANFNFRNYIVPVVLSVLILTSFKVLADENPSNKLTRVVIDAGHGGEDPGAVGLNSKEKDITLSVVLKVGALIEKNLPSVQVIYTRKEDVFIPLHERADIANKNHSDLFISIHVNANTNRDALGFESYVMGIDISEKNMAVAMKENAVISYEKDYKSRYEGYDPNSAESFIIFSLVQNVYIDQSLIFAALLQEHSKTDARRYDRGVKQERFLVLWRTTMPSVLIELGFLSNKKEEQYLLSDKGQEELAHSIFNSFLKYKQNLEHKTAVYQPQSEEETKLTEVKNDTAISGNSIIFRVQIVTARNSISKESPDFKHCKQIKGGDEVKEYNTGKIIKYAIGKKTDYNDAQRMLKEVKKFYPDAFIVSEKNGKLIPLQEAIKK